MMRLRPKIQDLVRSALQDEDGRAAVEARRKAKVVSPAVVMRGLSVVGPGSSVEVCEVDTDGTSSAVGSSIADESRNVAVDTDIVMSEPDDHTSDQDAEDLLGRASLVAGMNNVSVDADLSQDMAAQECKFDAVFSAPPAMRINSICVPIMVQNVVCFGGSSLSGFTAATEDSVVQLGHEVFTIPCVGSVELKLEYKISDSHKFEVLICGVHNTCLFRTTRSSFI
ncbi:hypothetical protein FB192DRAFT_1440293 [Mucor lusitanicus]|uniref:Uncharacterized protein n=1 Tax=Mucor circinelloides f. lusitanicus TaxID=29924 RepID=A0A8H4EY00_MUCCL|nr:hypothetical protein FB192DRAFT_1440293 [Mucor lusitanicus]